MSGGHAVTHTSAGADAIAVMTPRITSSSPEDAETFLQDDEEVSLIVNRLVACVGRHAHLHIRQHRRTSSKRRTSMHAGAGFGCQVVPPARLGTVRRRLRSIVKQ